MKTLFITGAFTASLILTSLARTWTSSDGSKTFQGEFIESDGQTVTVLRKGQKLSFSVDKLSEADQKWITEAQAQKHAQAQAADFPKTKFGKALKKLKKLDGKRYKSHELESVPQYFLLYYSASW